MTLRDNLRDFFHGAAYGAYERELRMQAAELNDMFLLLCYMESVNTRFKYTMTPNPSLQVYAEPFVSTGEYTNFKELVDGRQRRGIAVGGTTVTLAELRTTAIGYA